MSIFDVNYIDVVWGLLVPPDKRLPKWLSWGATVMKGKQWLHDSIFTTYAGGDLSDMAYNPTATYISGQRVIYYIQSNSSGYTGPNAYYGNNGVYEAISINPDGTNNAGFSGISPTGGNIVPDTIPSGIINTTQALAWLYGASVNYPAWVPQRYIAGQIVTYTDGNAYLCILNTTSAQDPADIAHWTLFGKPGCIWVKVTPNFLGANERASYSAQKLIFEYALNRWFKTTFRQPVVGLSDIYININSNTANQFFWGQPPPDGTINSFFAPITNISDKTLPLSKYFTPGNSFLLYNDFSIYVPIAYYNALDSEAPVLVGSNTEKRDAIVRAFADLLNPAGSFYNIITY